MATFGFELLAEQAADCVRNQVSLEGTSWQAGKIAGDTPIEVLFSLSLFSRVRYGESLVAWRIVGGSAEQVETYKASPDAGNFLILQRQAKLADIGRVDFLIQVHSMWTLAEICGEKHTTGWRSLIVECDGHDFHERNKEQAANDRSRDRNAQMAGFEVFRFTGSELWRDPWGCAGQIIAWADKGA